jgi:mannose-6-phosphate isomerase-like protein (cupin superfamily)
MINVVAKGWGHELWIVNTENYCGKQLTVLPTKLCSLHVHKLKSETFYVVDGVLKLEYASSKDLDEIWADPVRFEKLKQTTYINKGGSFDLHVGQLHRFTSQSMNLPCTFIEFSTHHEDSDSYRLIKGD